MRLILTIFTVLLASAACRPQPAIGAAERPNLAKAKALIEATAQDFELAATTGQAAAKDPAKAREIGATLRKNMEARRSEGEALQRLMTEDERRELQEFGRQRLVPAVRKLEEQLGTAPVAPPAAATATAG